MLLSCHSGLLSVAEHHEPAHCPADRFCSNADADADADRYVTGLVSRRSIRISPTDENQAWGPDHARVFVMSELELPASNAMLPEDRDMLLAAVTERVRGTASGIDIQSVRAALEECVQDLGMLKATLKPGRQDPKHLEVEAVLQQARSDLAALPVSRRYGPTEAGNRSGSTGVWRTG